MVNFQQQWQVIDRVAVKPATFKCLALFFQPGIESHDLALLIGRYALNFAAIAAVDDLRICGQNLGHPKAVADWLDNKAIGGGDNQQSIAGVAVLLQQSLELWPVAWVQSPAA